MSASAIAEIHREYAEHQKCHKTQAASIIRCYLSRLSCIDSLQQPTKNLIDLAGHVRAVLVIDLEGGRETSVTTRSRGEKMLCCE